MQTNLEFPAKTPTEYKDYTFDFTAWLALPQLTGGVADTISVNPTPPVVTCPDATLSISTPVVNAGFVTVWLSGGIAGRDYFLTCTIVTAQGRIEKAQAIVNIKPD